MRVLRILTVLFTFSLSGVALVDNSNKSQISSNSIGMIANQSQLAQQVPEEQDLPELFTDRRHPRNYPYFPSGRRSWNYYVWHFNPFSYPWYYYGYRGYPTGHYPGFEHGFHYRGRWACTGYDNGYEEHWGGHSFVSSNYNFAYQNALRSCLRYHGRCVVSCQRRP